MSDLINRQGKFSVHRDLIRGADNEMLLKIFANMIITRAEYMFIPDVIKYEALSPLFRETEQCEIPPEYEITCHKIYTDEGLVNIEIEAIELVQK